MLTVQMYLHYVGRKLFIYLFIYHLFIYLLCSLFNKAIIHNEIYRQVIK